LIKFEWVLIEGNKNGSGGIAPWRSRYKGAIREARKRHPLFTYVIRFKSYSN